MDLENEWLDQKSDYFVGDITAALGQINRLIGYCRSKKYKIIFITHIEKGPTTSFTQGSRNVEIIPGVDRRPSDVLIKKNKISPFYKTKLEEELCGIDEIVVCGILSNLCVRSTIQDAYDLEFKIIVIKDCCVSFDKKIQDFTFNDLKATRPEIEFYDLSEFVTDPPV